MTDAAERFASRKFAVTVLCIVIATVLSVVGMLDPLWVDCVTWLAGLYMVGNVGATLARRVELTEKKP